MFCKKCGKNINERKSCPYCGDGKTEEYISLTPKNWILSSPLSLDNTSLFIAGILQIFTGCFGLGRFYMKSYKIGTIQLLVTLLSILLSLTGAVIFLSVGFIWGIIDGIMILSGKVRFDTQKNFFLIKEHSE